MKLWKKLYKIGDEALGIMHRAKAHKKMLRDFEAEIDAKEIEFEENLSKIDNLRVDLANNRPGALKAIVAARMENRDIAAAIAIIKEEQEVMESEAPDTEDDDTEEK
jgi:hypothetical protein